MHKNVLMIVITGLLGGALAASGAEQKSSSSHSSHSISRSGGGSFSSSGGGSGIGTSTENGQTKVTWKGQEVWSGTTTGAVSARSASENGTEYAAAFDGDKVLWENTSGAAEHLKGASSGVGLSPTPPLPNEKGQKLKKKRSDA